MAVSLLRYFVMPFCEDNYLVQLSCIMDNANTCFMVRLYSGGSLFVYAQ